MIRAVIFDLDGVIVDTEAANLEVAISICSQLGITLSKEEKQSSIGVTSLKFYTDLFQKRNIPANLNATLQRHFATYEEQLRGELIFFHGAKNVIEETRAQQVKLGLVTGSTTKQMKIILTKLGALNLFDVFVSADDVTTSKPSPQGYLLAAKKLTVDPSECLVLEDSTPGISAAKKAGMRVIGVVNNGGQNLSEADVVIPDLESFDFSRFKV